MGWYPCCCDETPPCDVCDDDMPETITVTFNGFGDLTTPPPLCSLCDDLNAAYILTATDECEWTWSGKVLCDGYANLLDMTITATVDSTNWRVTVILSGLDGDGDPLTNQFGFVSLGHSSPIDCTDYYFLVSSGGTSSDGSTFFCVYGGVGCDVN